MAVTHLRKRESVVQFRLAGLKKNAVVKTRQRGMYVLLGDK
jgi:hypothetical protein